MDYLNNLQADVKHLLITPKNSTKSFANKNINEITEDNYCLNETNAFTGEKFHEPNTNFVKIITNAKEFYEGEVDKNFTRSGYGVYNYANGDVYEGEFKNGLREGTGEYKYIDGCVYRGEWAEDKKEGKGVFIIGDKEYAGKWANDFFKSGFKYDVSEFEKKNFEPEDDCDYDDYINSFNSKELPETPCRNADISVSKFESNSSELWRDYNSKNVQAIFKDRKTLTQSNYRVNISMEIMQNKKVKSNTRNSTNSTTINLPELSTKEDRSNPDESWLNSCYNAYFSQVINSASQDDGQKIPNNSEKKDILFTYDNKTDNNCECGKFLSEIIKT